MQFLLIGLDGVDDEAPVRRQSVRPQHIARGNELMESGNLWYGAALLDDDGNMKGSMYFMDFASEDELNEYLETEPYMIGDVWRDLTIHKSNVRDPWLFNRDKEFFTGCE